jgi:Protein of unknown function (DUF2510)
MTMQLPPAGWYPDPEDGGRLRYFNGSTWTDHRAWAGQHSQQPPPQMQSGAGGRGSSGKAVRILLLVAPIAIVLICLFFIGWQIRDIYEYHVGTTTTATIDRCTTHGKSETCYGTWSVDGRSQSGPIHGAGNNDRTGTTLDVHVSDGTAYTAAAGQWVSYVNILGGTFFMALVVFGFSLGFKRMFGEGSRRTRP